MIYVITNIEQFGLERTESVLNDVLPLGIYAVQYRYKNIQSIHYIEYAKRLQSLCRKYRTHFIVNDDFELAVATNACGIHVGQEDICAHELRTQRGYKGLIGVTAKTLEQARSAQQNGADYLGVGAFYPSSTKSGALPVSLDTLSKIKEHTKIPVFGIGGLTPQNLTQEIVNGVDGICFSNVLWTSNSPMDTVKSFKSFFR